ncbi:MAG: outer membrane beta-barrel protein [Bacteroidales bacterium]|nr:outer membrane beta-barrel protein [Bacteroidales bacterium]
MKKLFAIVALVAAMFVAGNVQAQNMVYVGYAPETFAYSNSSTNYQGIFAGFSKNVNLAQGIGVAAGAQFRMNMKNTEDSNQLGSIKTKNNQFLVDVPILLNYSIAINRDLAITPFIGPMVSLAVSGNTKTITHENLLNTTHEETLDWYGDNSNMNRFNLYGVFGASVRFNDFNLFGGYRMGLTDLDKSDNGTLKTSGLFVGLGFSL